MGHLLGAKKKIFLLIRDIDDATVAAAPVESCQSLPKRCPWGRLGSLLDTCNRLRRMRGRFHRWIPMRTGAQLPRCLHHDPPKFWIQSSLESTERSRMRSRRPSDLRPIPERVREPTYIRKSKQCGPDGAPFPSKTSITRGPPVVAVAVSLDPILPQR